MAEAPAGGAAEAHCESYPSTPHLPFSPEVHSDDTVLCDEQGLCFASGDIVVTEKLDGGNCCIHQGRVYARTHAQEATHRSFGPIKALAATLCGAWDSDLAFFGENMTGIHSIEYKNLTSYFYLFAVRRADGHWLPWAAVEQHAERLGLPTVPVLFKGRIPSLQDLRGLMDRAAQSHSAVGLGVKPEGFVVRAAGGFSDAEFPMAVAKYVRKGHVQTDDDWRRTWRKAALGAPCAPPPEHVAGSPDMAHASSDAAGPEAVGTSDRDHPAQPPAPAAPSPSPTPASGGSEEGPGKGAGAECASSSAKAGQRPSKLQLPKFVMLVGLPGSGKSTFGKLLLGGLSGGPQQWHHICQDEAGSRDACEAQLGHCAKDRNAHIILDRCNAEAQDRKDWLALAWKPKGAVAVFFDVPAALCRERVARRRDHPTIPEGMGGRIVESFAKKLQRPQVSEGFKEVHVVSSAEDCARLLATRFGVQVAADAIGADAALFKFPRTHHLIDVGGAVSRDDLVMTGDEILPWLGPVLTVEEKVDGANLGISLTRNYEIRFQNRSHHVTSETATQFKGLDNWARVHEGELCQILEPERHVLFGEWCYAKHSIHYTHLPDWFIAFDIYDRAEGRFFSAQRRDAVLGDTSIAVVPRLAQRAFKAKADLLPLLDTLSGLRGGQGTVEGVYVRWDKGEWLERRAKVVRADFVQAIDVHWTKQTLTKNVVRS